MSLKRSPLDDQRGLEQLRSYINRKTEFKANMKM